MLQKSDAPIAGLRHALRMALALLCAGLAAGCADPASHDAREVIRTNDLAHAAGDADAALPAAETDAESDLASAPDGDAELGPDSAGLPEDATSPSHDTADAAAADVGPDGVVSMQRGTFEDPIIIAELPFVDHRDTTTAPGPLFAIYDCEPSANEGGNGFVYRFDLDRGGVLSAHLDDVPADRVDVDVHLLTAPDPDSCIVRDNLGYTIGVAAGTYWIVVDTWVSDAGDALPGPYTLTVDFASDQDLAPLGSVQNPIVVTDYPFHDRRDTRLAPSSVFDAYSCAPSTDMGGGEFVYRLILPTAGTLALSVDDHVGDDIDVDLQLLDGPRASACIARNNIALSAEVQAGTLWLVVDSWVNAAGRPLAGPYLLDVDFTPAGPAPTGAGILAEPIRIAQFPFRDASTTLGAPSLLLDGYGCRPTTNESGPEIVYSFSTSATGVLVASLDDRPGDRVDVDLHLLRGANPASDCLAADDRSFAQVVSPGTYLLVVDSWAPSGGSALPGPYTLDVDLLPLPELERGCLTLYGDTRGADSGDAQLAHRAVVSAIADKCASSTMVHSGDLVRSGSSASDWASFLAIEAPLQGPTRQFFPVRGNHDGNWSDMVTHLAPMLHSPLPESQYVRALWPHVWLVALDSQLEAAECARFLSTALDAPERAGDRFVVAFHRPLYPSIGGHAGWSAGQSSLAPIIKRHAGRILVVNGHNHGLSREVIDGVTYVTSGGGGAPRYGCGQVHQGTRYCANSYGYFACDPDFACAAWEIDPATGRETLSDVFTVR